jgi:hypothetical protein
VSGRVRGPGRARVVDNGVAPWWPAADVAILGAMVATGSLLLVSTYGGVAPVIATALGVSISVAVLVVVHRLRLPRWVTVPAIVLGVVLLGSLLIAPRLRVVGFLPSVTGMARVLRGTVDGWRELLTVATPTGVTGALLVPPLIVGSVGVAIAGALAMTRRPALALLVPAASVMLFALLGNGGAAPLTVAVVVGGYVTAGVSWAVWVGTRTRRRTVARAADGNAAGHRASARSAESVTRQALAVRRAGISAAVLAVAVLVGVVTADAATPNRTALREIIELPAEPAAFVSPLSTFRTYTKDQADAVQLTVSGLPAGARLRLAALDTYDGRQFTLSNSEGPFVRIGRERPGTVIGEPVTVRVELENYSGQFLPLPGAIERLDFTGPRTTTRTEDLRYSEAAATGLMPGGWQQGDRYIVTAAVPPQPTAAELAQARPLAAPFPTTVALPDPLRSTANKYIGNASGAAAQVEAIRAGLANDGLFSHGTPAEQGQGRSPAGHGLDRLTAMVAGGQMVGDQEQYAALMALLVRSVGLPARVVVGFEPTAGSTAAGSDEQVQIRGRDISAWVEVPFEGYGWVAFDPTPSIDKPPPDAKDQPSAERRIVNAEVPPAVPQALPDSLDAENANQRPAAADPDTQSVDDSGWLTLVGRVLLWVLLVLAVLAVPVCVVLAVKAARRRRRRTAEHPKAQIIGGWEQLLDVAVDTGYRPAPWHTRTEAAADLQTSGVLLVDWLAPAADAAEFSPSPVNSERARGYWREVDDRSAELLGALPFWRRWRARLSLASMRRMKP